MRNWIICWSTNNTGSIIDTKTEDHWLAEESYDEALRLYQTLAKNENVYSASICAVHKSTDYETHPVFMEEA